MKPYPLPALTQGVDVLTPEGSLPKGAVRSAANVVLQDDGGFTMRPGRSAVTALADAHSLWRSPAQTRTLVAAQNTLYDVTLPDLTVAPLFTALPWDAPVSYEDVGPDVYFTAGGVLRKIATDGTVRRPGIADLLGMAPLVSATTGGLAAGRYGVAYSLINDLGEESPLSSISWIDLDAGGGVSLIGLQTAPDVVKVALYVTTANGGELYHHDTRTFAAAQTITDQTLGKLATRQHRQPMPGGEIVRLYRGRLYVVSGRWVYISDPLDYGVMDVKGGWLTFNRTINVFEPVAGGIFVGLRERTIFLRGSGPKDFEQVEVAARGALAQSGARMPADFFAPALAPNRDLPVATWLSDAGLAIGRPDGSIAYPQAHRLTVAGDSARALFAQQNGIKQVIHCVDAMTLGVGGAADLTL